MRRRAVIALGGDALSVGFEARDGRTWAERTALPQPDALPRVLDAVFARRDVRSSGSVRVLLQPPHVQTRTLSDLPPVPPHELNALVEVQARRFFRTNGASLVAGAVRLPGPGGVDIVRAAAADRALVAALEGAARRARIERLTVTPDSGDGTDSGILLETPEGRGAKRWTAWRGVLSALALAAACWAGAGATYGVDLAMDRRAVRAELTEVAEPLARIREIRSRVEEFAPVAEAVRVQGPEGAWLVELLARIAEGLPDSCHVLSLETRRGGPVRIDLRAADPAEVIKALEAAGFVQLALAEPPTAPAPEEGPRAWSRFALGMGGVRDQP